jgi:hypothetical protein
MTLSSCLASLPARHHLVGHTPPLLHIGPGWTRHDGLRPRVEEALTLRGAYLGWAGVEAYVKGLWAHCLIATPKTRATSSSGRGHIIARRRGRTDSIQIVIECLFFGASPQLIARPAFKLAHALPR